MKTRHYLSLLTLIALLLTQAGSGRITLGQKNRSTDMVAAPSAPQAQLIVDPGFENGSPWTAWTVQTSTNFGSSLCNTSICSTNGGLTAAFAGTNWNWFGGGTGGNVEDSTTGQSVVIPSGTAANLTFQMKIQQVNTPFTDTVQVRVDGVTQATYTEPATGEATYTQRTVNLNAFANGASHSIVFSYHSIDGASNFLIDDINLTTSAFPELLYASDGINISRFISDNLGSVTTVPITGLQAGETLVGLDRRTTNGSIYGIGSTSRVYTINPNTGAASQVGLSGQFTLNGTAFGSDFNPVADRIRVVSNTEQNLRLNPNDGTLAGTDTALTPAGNIVAAAYDRNDTNAATPTTLYAIDSAAGTLVTIGSIDGSPNSPNAGQVTTIGSLGLGTNLNEAIGFDVSGATGIAFASLTTGGISRLYTINLSTGAATLVGAIGSGTVPFPSLTAATGSLHSTAAGVTISGRILSPDGRGLRNARVTIMGGDGLARTVVTGSLGRFVIDDVPVGQSYVVSVSATRFRYTARLIQPSDSIADLNFVPVE